MSVIVHACEDGCPLHEGLRCKRDLGHTPPHRAVLRSGAGRIVIEWKQTGDVSGGHNAASVCAEAIRALATPTKPGDETK